MNKVLLNTYQPLCLTNYGKKAISEFNISPYVDGSCRREPDFESLFPSITALCRGRACAPRLQVGDIIVYLTVKRKYEEEKPNHRKLVSILKVIKRFNNHQEGARWYKRKNLPIPSNCLIENNPPLEIKYTLGLGHREMKRLDEFESNRKAKIMRLKLQGWDNEYWEKVNRYPVFLVTEAIYLNLNEPPSLFDEDLIGVFGKIPMTRTPPIIEQNELEKLLNFAKL